MLDATAVMNLFGIGIGQHAPTVADRDEIRRFHGISDGRTLLDALRDERNDIPF
jgi:hypothetical protein